MADNRNFLQRVAEYFSGSPKAEKQEQKAEALHYQTTSRGVAVSFNGEKNLGEIGPARSYSLDYDMLRVRSWQAYIESEVFRTIVDKFTLWVISGGLKLQTVPIKQVLKGAGINLDSEAFNEAIETRFFVYAKSTLSDYAGSESLNSMAETAFKNAKIGGDVLVVLRVEKGILKVQLIDGCHIQSPSYGTEEFPQKLENGNWIANGVEYDAKGMVTAYHVMQADYSFTRIPAKNSLGFTIAYMVKGSKYRIDNKRGVPVMATVLESLKKLERYKEATLGSAEESAKIAFQIVHNINGSGENPMVTQLAKAMDVDNGSDLPEDKNGKQLANTVAATTNKSVYNMPQGAELKLLEANKRELYFKDFYSVNIDLMCAAIGIPPNVAMSVYNDSFSASRAALKDWEHVIKVNREDFTQQFYQPIFNLFLHLEILGNKVSAPGYLSAFTSGDEMVINAYRNCRFTGATPGHIDPLKEVNAVRAALGEQGANIPLISVEMAVELLNGASSDDVMEQFSKELQYNKDLGNEPKVVAPIPPMKDTSK